MVPSVVSSYINDHRNPLAFGLGGFAGAILTTLFGLFNVILFTEVVHINPSYFYGGHIIYGIWNAVNDPAFGWLLDHTANRKNRRLPVIYFGGPVWCLTFMLSWYPWSYDGESWLAFAHFLFTMFSYDGFLTYVYIVKCALLADLVTDSTERIQLNTFSAWFDFFGSCLALTAYYSWNSSDLGPFRRVCWLMATISACAWYFSGKLMVLPMASHKKASHVINEDDTDDDDRKKLVPTEAYDARINQTAPSNTWAEEFQEWLGFAKQLFEQKNFVLYVAMNWLMNFNVFLSTSFFVFADKFLMKRIMPGRYRAVITALALYAPKVGIQVMAPFAERLGLHEMIKRVNLTLILLSCLALLGGQSAYYMWGVLLVIQMMLFKSWGYYDLIIADIIDEDRVQWKREESVSTSIHGVHALFVKPAQSLAPIFGVALLNRSGIQDAASDGEDASAELQQAVFLLTFGCPLICTICQHFIWREYDLHGAKLRKIKDVLKNGSDMEA